MTCDSTLKACVELMGFDIREESRAGVGGKEINPHFPIPRLSILHIAELKSIGES